MKINRQNRKIGISKILTFFLISFIVSSCLGSGGKESTISKEPSYMYALVEDGSVTLSAIEENIEKNNEFVVNSKTLDDNVLQYVIQYKETEFIVDIMITDIEGVNYYRNIHGIEDAEYEKVINTTNTVGTRMVFTGSNLESFHFQLKLLNAIAPNLLAVVDYNSYTILARKWVDMSAKSEIAPPPAYISGVFVVGDENEDNVWLYTSGLRRVGSMEIEIVNSNRENYMYHYYILENLAQRIASYDYLPKSKESIMAIRDVDLTWISTKDALKDVKKDRVGSSKNRENDDYKDTAVIYFYPNENAAKSKKVSPMLDISDDLKSRTMFYINNEETARMSALAKERWEYPVKVLNNPKYEVQMKFAIPVDVLGRSSDSSEHMWFQIKEINGEEATGILLNEPYDVAYMKLGDEVKLKKSQLTDWIILSDDERIVPDTAYKLE